MSEIAPSVGRLKTATTICASNTVDGQKFIALP